jgi:tetratricopeptide (TPR) repeat protein
LRANGDARFFLWLHYFDPHKPYLPSVETDQLVPGSRYHAEIRLVDQHIALLMVELERLGLADETLVVLTADHGESLGEHGESTHSYFVYETTMRVPLIFAGAGLPTVGVRIPALVRTVDIAPTILDLVGLPPLEDTDGVSLRPLMSGAVDDMELTAYGESAEATAFFGIPVLRSLRRGNWKYVHTAEPELYDLAADPAEVESLSARRPEIVAELQAELERLVRVPAREAASRLALDEASQKQLEQLGYIAAEPAADYERQLEVVELDGADHSAKFPDFEAFLDAASAETRHDPQRAVSILEPLFARYPASAMLYQHLMLNYRSLRRWDRSAELSRRMLEENPADPTLATDLAQSLMALGELSQADALVRSTLAKHPCHAPAQFVLAALLRSGGRHPERIAHYETSTANCEPTDALLNDYAYALATSPVAELRNGKRALRIARKIVAEGGRENPAYVDTLAAAFAEIGKFPEAIHSAKRALALAAILDDRDSVLDPYREHLRTLESQQPIRED